MVDEHDQQYRKRKFISREISTWIIVEKKEKKRGENLYGNTTHVIRKCD